MSKPESLWSRYIWLAYAAFFFVQPVLDRSVREWAIFLPWFSAFLFCYIYPERQPRAGIWCVLAMLLLGVGYAPFNPGVSGIFIFVSAFIPFVLPGLTAQLVSIAAVALIVSGEGLYFHFSPWLWTMMAGVSSVVGGANIAAARDKRQSARLLRAQEEIEHLATVAERERIARDLHDVLGHTLSMITLKAELAGKLLHSDPQRAAIEIADVEQSARRALAEVREAVGGYRAQGLQAELARAGQTLASAGVDLEADTPPRGMEAAEETVLALIVREAVTNIVRHSHATECRIRFVTEGSQILLTIADNGAGDGQSSTTREGNGLRGMKERAEALGGEFSWQRGAGPGRRRGMELRVQVPLRVPQAAAVTPQSKPQPLATKPQRDLNPDQPLHPAATTL